MEIEKDSFVGKEVIRVSKDRIKRLKKEIYNCCKTKQTLCRVCFDKYHIVEELMEDMDE